MVNENTKQIIFLIALVICIFLFAITLKEFIKNKNLITSDPLNYGMKIHDFVTCSCTDSKGNIWTSTEKGFMSQQKVIQEDIKFNLTDIK
jgi:hypothetical protein